MDRTLLKSDTEKRQTCRKAAQTIRFLYQRKDLSIRNLDEFFNETVSEDKLTEIFSFFIFQSAPYFIWFTAHTPRSAASQAWKDERGKSGLAEKNTKNW